MSNNKRILKNSLYLYLRMIITTVVTLFTIRILLMNIGVVDYGIFSLVGSVIVMISFFNNALSSSTQRFLSLAMSKDENFDVSSIFNASLRIHIAFSIFIVLVGETLGVYILDTYLSIPAERQEATSFLFQCVIFIFSLNIISIPYQALIIAEETMEGIAIIQGMESVGKLIIAIIIGYLYFDKLKAYGVLLLLLAFIVFMFYILFFKKSELHIKITTNKINKSIYEELLGFVGWTAFGTIAPLSKKQGSVILLNIFFGPIVLSAFAIADQVSNQIGAISSTVLKAITPQIVKSYGNKDSEGMFYYILVSSRLSFYLFMFIAIPLFFELDFVLNLWLDEVPLYTIEFVKLMLVFVLIEILIGPLVFGIQATGKIKKYQLVASVVFVFNSLLMYFLLKLGYTANSVLYCNIVFTFLVGFVRLYYLNKLVGLSIGNWLFEIFTRCFLPFSIASLSISLFVLFIDQSFIRIISTSLLNFVICVISIYFLGLNANEKSFVDVKFKRIFNG